MNAAALEDRRNLVRESLSNPTLSPVNGIDFLQVDPADETRLIVQFIFDVDTTTDPPLSTAVGSALSAGQFSVTGGERITNVQVKSIQRVASQQIAVVVDQVGDFSTYTLRIGTAPPAPPAGEPPDPSIPPVGFDPMLCSIEFLFHIECAKQFDCKPATVCVQPPVPAPNIDYLARDYPAFVQVMLDRLSLLAPRWQERNPADLGVAVVEMLAYVADQLSYRHDVIDTEAYLGTARLRTSIRRHARLVDYRIDDGCNSRAWVSLQLSGDLPQGVPAGTRCCTVFDGSQSPVLPRDADSYNEAITAGAQFFEVMPDRFDLSTPTQPVPFPRPLSARNNIMPFYNWSARQMCLPVGTTAATLAGSFTLKRGDFVILAEALGPLTGAAADADPAKRCVVRLVRDGELSIDPLTRQPLTRIAWHTADALTFPLCVSSVTDDSHGDLPISGVSVAYGNVVLVDQGRTLGDPLETMPEDLGSVSATGRYRPSLSQAGVTIAGANPYGADLPGDPTQVIQPAASATRSAPVNTIPTITLGSQTTTPPGSPLQTWYCVGDLLDAGVGSQDPVFEVEVENDGTSYIRFGDGVNGMAAPVGVDFTASYRVGNGTVGNVAADTIQLIDRTFPGAGFIQSLTNPLAAFGGRDPETLEHVRQNAPVAFRTQERAVTPADYVARAMQFPGVARAAATFRWTGSWTTVFLTVERTSGELVDPNFKANLEAYLERYRMAGYDLEVEDAVRVPLLVAMQVCVASGYVAADIEQLLLAVFTSGLRPDGSPGVFNPQRFLMGEPFYLSPLYAAAQSIQGVSSVCVTRFERQQSPDGSGLRNGVLVPGPLELFELANDPDFPERGQFVLAVDGGL
jgi:Baseplate J-like protein